MNYKNILKNATVGLTMASSVIASPVYSQTVKFGSDAGAQVVEGCENSYGKARVFSAPIGEEIGPSKNTKNEFLCEDDGKPNNTVLLRDLQGKSKISKDLYEQFAGKGIGTGDFADNGCYDMNIYTYEKDLVGKANHNLLTPDGNITVCSLNGTFVPFDRDSAETKYNSLVRDSNIGKDGKHKNTLYWYSFTPSFKSVQITTNSKNSSTKLEDMPTIREGAKAQIVGGNNDLVKYSLPGYNVNAQATHYENENLTDVVGFNAEDNWNPIMSKWGKQTKSMENLRASLVLDFLDNKKHHLAGAVFAEAYGNKIGGNVGSQENIILSENNFDYILSKESCVGEDTCLTVTPEELVNAGHGLGYVVSMKDVLVKQASEGNYSLEVLASTIQNDGFTSNFNDSVITYIVAPVSTVASFRTAKTDNLEHDFYDSALSSSLENCIYSTIDGVKSKKMNSGNEIINCSYNNSFGVLENIMVGNKK